MLKIPLSCLAVGLALACSPASAVETTFTGFTDGCFGLACAPTSNPAPTSISLAGLTYTNSTFNVTTSGGFVSIGSAPGTPNLDNLGSFSLSGDPFSYNGQHFSLLVSFTAPVGTSPTTALFTDNITGSVTSIGNGGVFIDFDNAPQHFTFGNGGSFDFFLNDVSVTAGSTVAVSGTIISQIAAIPEASTWAMMVLGFAGIGLLGYRRRAQGTVRLM